MWGTWCISFYLICTVPLWRRWYFIIFYRWGSSEKLSDLPRCTQIVAETRSEPRLPQEEAEGACQWERQNSFPSIRLLTTQVWAFSCNFWFWVYIFSSWCGNSGYSIIQIRFPYVLIFWLLRYNSYTRKLSLLWCILQWVLIYPQNWATITTKTSRYFWSSCY